MDVFGRSTKFGGGGGVYTRRGLRGDRGEKGIPGKDGIDSICLWFPNSLLKTYRECEENLCLLLRNLEKDVSRNQDGVVLSWNSQACIHNDDDNDNIDDNNNNGINGYGNMKLTSHCPSRTINRISMEKQRYSLDFHKNVYFTKSKNVNIFRKGTTNSYVNICITFKTSGEGEQVLISNRNSNDSRFYREILTDGFGGVFIIDVCNEKRTFVPIHHNTRFWTTIFVERFHDETNHTKSVGRYVIFSPHNEMKSEERFSCIAMPSKESACGIALGGRLYDNNKQCFVGSMSALEVYTSIDVDTIKDDHDDDGNDDDNGESDRFLLPESFKSLLIKDQLES